ncbi:GDSL family lipase [Sphingobium sp. CAP-1]|nr:GDSL family lipase [Sphingobium sp. CAP-1]
MLTRRAIMGMAAGLPLGAAMPAVAQDCPPQSETERRLHSDFAWLGRYAADNRALIGSGAATRIIFMGDSITQGWQDKCPAFFGPGRVNRGIGGQTTSQMLLRMMADVVALKPRAVHIMAGTNDIAGNSGPMTEAMSQDNLAAMVTLARAHDIRVLIGSIPPAALFPWRPGLDTRTPIASLNRWLRGHAGQSGATWIDYHAVLNDGSGGMKPGLAYDGVHPTEAGYDAMASLIAPILASLRL